MDAQNQAELVRQAQVYFLMGRGMAELHALGGSLPGARLLDSRNFVVAPPDDRLRISSEGMAHVVFRQAEPEHLNVAERIENMRDAAARARRPHWQVFAAGYRERSAELGQSEVAEAALHALDALLDRVEKARMLHAHALELSTAGRHQESAALLEQEVAIWEQLGMADIAGRVRINLGGDYGRLGHEATAEESYQQAYQIAKRYEDDYGLVMACTNLAMHHERRGDPTAAKEYARQGLAALSRTEMSRRDTELLRQTLEKISGERRAFWRRWA